MNSPSWNDSVFFFRYDEAAARNDHVTAGSWALERRHDKSLGTIPDLGSVSVSPDSYIPCVPTAAGSGNPVVPTTHCDAGLYMPGAHADDAAAVKRIRSADWLPDSELRASRVSRADINVSHFHDHTGHHQFVENRFLGPNVSLTARERRAQPKPAGLL